MKGKKVLMIDKDNFKRLLQKLGFIESKDTLTKDFPDIDATLKVDFKNDILIYPEDKGFTVNERQTCNFSSNENFVVFECVHRLLQKGYKPEHIELEPKWKVGHGASGGRADILIRDNNKNNLLIIECKTAGKEFDKAWKDTQFDGDQLFSYAQQIPDTKFLCLYTSDLIDDNDIKHTSHIISHKDNKKILEENKDLKSFEKANNVKERFAVWRDTYKLEFTTKGIFEKNIQAYNIGKDKYTIEDLLPVDAKNKEGKYHEFRTILRKHNVSGRENAFDVLVNLFLCKIVDETLNTQDLKFYWKGIAYDSFFDLIDRLQELYKTGMDKFLAQEIVYISNKQIDEAFWTVKQKRNATKQQIKDYFRKLKFFTNNDFGFIDVHNEKQFYQNAKVLLEIVQMWQDLRLKTENHNQFLGDMFEFFLDNGIKQSEGQFFTPMPICKFILMSLPLETIVKEHPEQPKSIDYACGAGHFLTELAAQTAPFIKQYKQGDLKDFYKSIVGIEKEYRLSKVAKLSSFMYGHDGIEILHNDALVQNEKIKDGSFDILVANPPFAVEGFLDILPEEQREKYKLSETVSDIAGNKFIQCFFIERAKQLLAPNGVAGIIVPYSILTNPDSTSVATREIILKYFDIVSLVELGSGTFGKTGTPTVILFLHRKTNLPEPAEHFKNRVDDWFEGIDNDDEISVYQDLQLLNKYCEHIGIELEHYKSLLDSKISDELNEYEIIKDYKIEFDGSTDIKNLKTKKFFNDLSKPEQELELNKRFIEFVRLIEKDKLYYFILAFTNPQKLLIVKSPTSNTDQKQFLGYEWSAAKGSEGIRYNGGSTINDITTPLFNPLNPLDTTKINYLIQQNFIGNPPDEKILQEHKGIISYLNVFDILDFSQKSFNKSFSLSPNTNEAIPIEWSLSSLKKFDTIFNNISEKAKVEIEKEFKEAQNNTTLIFRLNNAALFDISIGKRVVTKEIKETKKGIPVYSANVFDPFGLIDKQLLNDYNSPSVLWGIDGDWMVNYIEKNVPFYPTDHCGVVRIKGKDIHPRYFSWVLEHVGRSVRFSRTYRASTARIKGLSINVPSYTIQEKIVKKIEEIETQIAKAKKAI
jgi:type I restriction-modification system DNA methylase subunit